MTMDYGSTVDNNGQMGLDATSAATNAAVQIHQAGLTSSLGITPLIGENDIAGEIFTLADAQTVVDYARQNAFVTRIAMWSVARDNGSCPGVHGDQDSCSGLSQSTWQFSTIFLGFAAGS